MLMRQLVGDIYFSTERRPVFVQEGTERGVVREPGGGEVSYTPLLDECLYLRDPVLHCQERREAQFLARLGARHPVVPSVLVWQFGHLDLGVGDVALNRFGDLQDRYILAREIENAGETTVQCK